MPCSGCSALHGVKHNNNNNNNNINNNNNKLLLKHKMVLRMKNFNIFWIH